MGSIRLAMIRGSLGSGVWAPALQFAVLLTSSVFADSVQAGDQRADDQRTGQAFESGVDPSVNPGDDFFAYANGRWLKSTEIPAGADRWGARHEIEALTQQQITRLFDDARTAPVGSNARKVADFYAAYRNEAAIETRGLAPLKPLLDSIDQLRDKAALTRHLGSHMGTDVDPLNIGVFRSTRLLGLAVERSIHGEKTNVAFLVQGGLGLPDREQYLSAAPEMAALRIRYQAYISGVLKLAGFDRAEQRAAAVMALETALAKSQATPEQSANDHNADTLWTRADFARQAAGMDWPLFLTAAGLARQASIVPWQPGAVTGVAALVAANSLAHWQDYLRFHAIDEWADVLPRAFAEPALAMRAAAAGQTAEQAAGQAAGQATDRARPARALAATQKALSEAIGRMYAERYFPTREKARVGAIVANVVAAFRKRVEAATWMSPATRNIALTKVKTLYIGIGYPDRWQDYSDLAVDPLDAAGNLSRVGQRNYRRVLARLDQPTEQTEWSIPPQIPGAVLIFQQNAYYFAAALLQPPKYDATATDAATYGAIGAIIGHDVSHFVDVLGAEFDTAGRERRWWTPADGAAFQAAADALVRQFSDYRPLPDLSVDGARTQTENIADLAGLTAAFDAYRLTLGNRVNDRTWLRQQDRQFFIAFAQSWRSKSRESALRAQIATNSHAPDNYRVATVRNIDAWYEAFDVKPGDRLYLVSGARVRIW